MFLFVKKNDDNCLLTKIIMTIVNEFFYLLTNWKIYINGKFSDLKLIYLN